MSKKKALVQERLAARIYVGVDPGKGGGIGFIRESDDGTRISFAWKMPKTPTDLVTSFASLRAQALEAYAVLEFVHSSPQMGVRSAFSFGQSFGQLESALAAAKFSVEVVRPQVWQKSLGCMSKGDKNVTKRRAQSLFPSVEGITHATADALLLAEYCRRILGGTYEDVPDIDDKDLDPRSYLANLPF